ncbi:MAG: PDZ domain-containing protein [Cyclobacteriaceae bacterium]
MSAIESMLRFYMRNPTASLIAFILLLNTCICATASGQKEFGFSMPEGSKKVEIEFEEYNNLIVIPITINRFLTLKFILDTGVETAILTEKLFADILDAEYIRELTIAGPGVQDSVEVYVANQMTFYLPGGLIGKNMNMLVLKEDYLQLSENMGDEIYGIIGYDVFSRFVVEIKYDSKKLVLHDPKTYRPKRRFTEIPIIIKNAKPYLSTSISQKQETSSLDIMVDTGASHAALLDFSSSASAAKYIPAKSIVTRLGTGIGGEISGYLSRLDNLSIAEFSFDSVLFSAPFEGIYNKSIKRGSEYGTIGGELLRRFNVIIDYTNSRMYLEKSHSYDDAFEHDMSGLTLNAKGENLDTLEVISLKEGSPAADAGIEVGDIIIRINQRNLRNSRLSEISGLLRRREGIRIKCRLLRDGEEMKKSFFLKRMI